MKLVPLNYACKKGKKRVVKKTRKRPAIKRRKTKKAINKGRRTKRKRLSHLSR